MAMNNTIRVQIDQHPISDFAQSFRKVKYDATLYCYNSMKSNLLIPKIKIEMARNNCIIYPKLNRILYGKKTICYDKRL